MDRSSPSKIKAVIFDYGEVLCHPPTAQEMGRMAASCLGWIPSLFASSGTGTGSAMTG